LANKVRSENRIAAILKTKEVKIGMVAELAELIEHPEDRLTFKANPVLSGKVLTRIEAVLEAVKSAFVPHSEDRGTQRKPAIAAVAPRDINEIAAAEKIVARVKADLTTTSLSLNQIDGNLVITVDGRNVGKVDLKLGAFLLTPENTTVRLDDKPLNLPEP
jgi:hypothetical protein